MSEHFTAINNTKLSNSVNSVNYFLNDSVLIEEDPNDPTLTYDHMYATNTENGEIGLTDDNCQDTESEVKFLKDWLILHLDLIQQQSDEILTKERTILILQQENEMLKERISCMERGAPFQASKFYDNPTSFLDDNLDMTQESVVCEEDEDNKDSIELLTLCENGADGLVAAKLPNLEPPQLQIESQASASVEVEEKLEFSDTFLNSDAFKIETDIADSSESFGFSVSDSGEFDPMRNLRMSIRKKRLSNSSAVSNADSVADDKRSFRRFKKRRKRVLKDSQLLTTAEQYITESGESNLGITGQSDASIEISNNTNLEVPRWRVKVYASCYTMEGTENLDDEVYNKRHSRLEIDERRRKRWDVQRIREQRVIEKLKLRQDRTGSGSRVDDQEVVQSLWPKLEDIKYLEVSEHLPVSAFGCPIPKISPSEFSLPWVNNPSILVTKKVSTKRSSVKRKSVKR